MAKVQNVMEQIIDEILDEYLKDADVCKCDICRADIKALALNNLPPKYTARQSGNAIIRMDYTQQQAHTDVLAAIVAAIEVIKENPRHE